MFDRFTDSRTHHHNSKKDQVIRGQIEWLRIESNFSTVTKQDEISGSLVPLADSPPHFGRILLPAVF